MSEQTAIGAFEELGLTRVEAEVYVFLVQNSPATGYAIAAAINRTKGATYKVLGSLAGRGAILMDDGQSRLARAVPPAEFLAQLEGRFREQRLAADEATRLLKGSRADQRIYQLTSVDQVYERVRQMLQEGQERALLEVTPGPLKVLRESLEDTATRGLDIVARVYEPVELAGIRVITSPYGEELAATWDAQWLAIFVDGRQHLLGQFSGDGRHVVQAVWSRSPFLSSAMYGYVNSDLHHYAFRASLQTAETVEQVRAEYDRLQRVFPVGGDLGWRDQVSE